MTSNFRRTIACETKWQARWFKTGQSKLIGGDSVPKEDFVGRKILLWGLLTAICYLTNSLKQLSRGNSQPNETFLKQNEIFGERKAYCNTGFKPIVSQPFFCEWWISSLPMQRTSLMKPNSARWLCGFDTHGIILKSSNFPSLSRVCNVKSANVSRFVGSKNVSNGVWFPLIKHKF